MDENTGILEILRLNPNDSIDREILELIEQCPILLDEIFLLTHPGIFNTATFLHTLDAPNRLNGKTCSMYQELGISSVAEYLQLIKDGNPEAIRSYKSVVDICKFTF